MIDYYSLDCFGRDEIVLSLSHHASKFTGGIRSSAFGALLNFIASGSEKTFCCDVILCVDCLD